MERIIHLLPTLADRYEACLIHRVWTTAAMNVLWECPYFSNVNAVRAFINTIHTYKRLALVVRHLNLCLDVGPAWPRNNSNNVSDSNNDDDDDNDKAFGATTSRLVLYQHEVYKESPLTSPHVIMTVLQQCERIDTLSIYGWKLEATHLRLIAAYLPRLQSLRIIGSLNKTTGSSNNKGIILPPLVASSLSKLHLYADYVVVPSRYMELESLRVSLSHSDSLEKLVYGHQHPLQKVRELMLGNVGVLKADHMKAIFHIFPNITRLAMEDAKQPIPYLSIVQLESLRHLIIRSMIDEVYDNNDKHNDNDSHLIHVGNNYNAHHECDTDDDISYYQSHLISICIENCYIQNNHFQRFVSNVDRLTRIILHKCPLLTDDALTRLCTIKTIPLEELKIVECIYIGNPTVRALTESAIICTLQTFEMRSNGYLYFKDVFDFITTASSHQLSHVVIAGYPDISISFLGQDSIDADVILNQSKIQSIVQHASAPKDRTLTSMQIIKLAKALDMDVHYLEELMEHIQLEDNENDECNNAVNLPLDANADKYNTYKHGNNNHSNNNHSSEVTKANAKLSLLSFQNYHGQQSEEKMDMNDYNQLTHERIEPDIIQKNDVYEENDDDGGSEDDESSDDGNNESNNTQNIYMKSSDCSDSLYNDTQEKEQQLQHVERQEEQEQEQQLLLLQNQSQNQYQYQYQYQHNQSQQQKQLQQEYRKQEIELPQYHEQQNHQLQYYQEDIIKKDEVGDEQEKKKNIENRNRANDIRNTLYNGNNLPNSSGSYSSNIRQQNGCYSTSSSRSSGDINGTNDISGNGSRKIPDLGGWGMTSDLSWLQNNNDNQCSEESALNSLHRSVGGHSYEHAWKQIAHESPIVTAKQTNDNRIVPTADAGEGWGTPKANISWNDERLSYAHDVVEEHKNMTFWNQDENGEWEELSNSNINSSNAPSYPPPLRIRSNHTTTSTLRPSVQRRKLYRSENLRLRPSSAFIPTSRPFRFEARNVKVSSQTLPVLSTSAQRQRSDGGANKWAAFSASQMQQSEAKKQKPATVQEEVKELEIPDLINLDLTDNDDMNQLVPTYKPTTATTSSDVEHGDIKSISLLLDLQ
ncbi:hypothetical protein INT45_006660 [Circinella minor]|uniref:F-box domain-containing protein n=1 Tax=Circinella minor TaxID=1195481 RepID=A0A8H7SAV9_9FUNG|nr:hypothetical protein INT45_006660 [Circinella minor]